MSELNVAPLFKVIFFPSLDDCNLPEADAEVPHPVSGFFERAELAATLHKSSDDWDFELGGAPVQKRATEVPHADGVEIEVIGKQVWKYRYKGGVYVGSEVRDPDLPCGGVMHFDGDGNEIVR